MAALLLPFSCVSPRAGRSISSVGLAHALSHPFARLLHVTLGDWPCFTVPNLTERPPWLRPCARLWVRPMRAGERRLAAWLLLS